MDWLTFVGGLLVALGVAVTGDTYFDVDVLLRNLPDAILLAYRQLSEIGLLLAALGILLFLIGLALTFRVSVSRPLRESNWTVRMLLVGGILSAIGLALMDLIPYAYPQALAIASLLAFWLSVDLAGHIVAGIGLFVALLGVASAVRQ